MTREEAKNKLTCYGYDDNGPLTDSKLIYKIYDDFESRICENCKHGEDTEDSGYDIFCTELNDYMYDGQSCKKFERKDVA